jgi:hypothetical protein
LTGRMQGSTPWYIVVALMVSAAQFVLAWFNSRNLRSNAETVKGGTLVKKITCTQIAYASLLEMVKATQIYILTGLRLPT